MTDETKVTEKQQYDLLRRLASRRFFVTCAIVIMSFLSMTDGLLPPESFEKIAIWVSGIYIVGKPLGDVLGDYMSKR